MATTVLTGFVGGVFIGRRPVVPWISGRAFYSRTCFYGRGFYGRGFYGRPDLVGVADLFAAARPAEASRAVGSAGARADSTAVVSAAADTDSSAEIWNENEAAGTVSAGRFALWKTGREKLI